MKKNMMEKIVLLVAIGNEVVVENLEPMQFVGIAQKKDIVVVVQTGDSFKFAEVDSLVDANPDVSNLLRSGISFGKSADLMAKVFG